MVAKKTSLTKKDLEEKISKLETDIDNLLQAATKKAEEAAKAPPPTPEPKPEPQIQTPPPPAPEPEPQLQPATNDAPKSRSEQLADYEKDYLARLSNELRERIELEKAAEELVAKRHAASQSQEQTIATRGTLPKGF